MKSEAACLVALSAALALAPAACGGKKGPAAAPPSVSAVPSAVPAAAPSAETVAKTWTGSQAVPDGGPARKVTLEMRKDGTGVLTIETGGKITPRNGKWALVETTVRFDPIEKDGSPGSQIVWAFRDGELAPSAWSGDDWGTSGPPVLDKAPK